MLRWLLASDRLLAVTRPAWGWLGELCLVVLGAHLAADRLDDLILAWLAPVDLPWPTPEFPISLATWTAVAVELHVVLWAAWVLIRSRAEPVTGAREWGRRASVGSLLAAVAWAPLALVGAWVVAMAFEDLVAPWSADAAQPLGVALAALIAWRLGWFGWQRVVLQAPIPNKRYDGVLAVPTVALVTGLAVLHGLPIRGWLG